MVAEGCEELKTIHAGHHEVQENEAGAPDLAQLDEGVAPIDGLNDGVPGVQEHVGDALAEVSVILDEKDGRQALSPLAVSQWLAARRRRGGPSGIHRRPVRARYFEIGPPGPACSRNSSNG